MNSDHKLFCLENIKKDKLKYAKIFNQTIDLL